jgi:hypothetical protein
VQHSRRRSLCLDPRPLTPKLNPQPSCVQEWLTQIFVAADADNNGSLDRDEFKVLMAELNLSEREALQVT